MILILLIILSSINEFSCCGFFDTRKTCDCSAVYSIGYQNKIKLFDLPSIIDCGLNLNCTESISCADRCVNLIRKTLGDSEFQVDQKAKNNICELVARNDEPIFRNGISLHAEWTYSGCSSGQEIIIADICCNRKCKCGLTSQLVTKYSNETFKNLVNFTNDLPYKEKAYECSLFELEECQNDCMNLISSYFQEPLIKHPNSSILNYNIFFKEFASNKVCNLLNKQINKPGIDIYAQIDATSANFSINYISLGRVCCRPICNCDYVFKNAFNGSTVIPNEAIIPSKDPLNIAYECSDELANCMMFCRKQAFVIPLLTNNIDLNLPISDLKPIETSDIYATTFCDKIKFPNIEHGYNVYLKYKNVDQNIDDSFPLVEDIHLGRLCCKLINQTNTLDSYINCQKIN